MRGLEEAAQEGLLEYHRDEQGEIDGIKIKAQARMGASSSVSARATVRKENDDPADQTQRMQGDE
jgi:hypothetical protein